MSKFLQCWTCQTKLNIFWNMRYEIFFLQNNKHATTFDIFIYYRAIITPAKYTRSTLAERQMIIIKEI